MGDIQPDPLLAYALERLFAERNISEVACKICGEKTELFDVLDFKKCCHPSLYPAGLTGIPVFYRSCLACKFIFTTFFDGFAPTDWLTHVYNDQYSEVDPEYLEIRPRRNVIEVEQMLAGKQNTTIGLDYGGGNGLTTKLLRQKGWTYDTHDPFGLSDVRPDLFGQYNFCSAFEVFEHSPDPRSTLSDILRMTSSTRLMIFIGTEVHDSFVRPDNRLTWWYAAPRNGHISLYSRRALQTLGSRFGLSYVSVSAGTHLFVRGIAERDARLLLLRSKILQRARRVLRLP